MNSVRFVCACTVCLFVLGCTTTNQTSYHKPTDKQSSTASKAFTISALAVINIGPAGSQWGHLTGKIISAVESTRQITMDPDEGSTIVRMNGTKWRFFHGAQGDQGQLNFTVAESSFLDWSQLKPGTQVSFDCKELPDFTFRIAYMSYK